MTNDFVRWSPRTPTTDYFLATLQVAKVSPLYECLCEPWAMVRQIWRAAITVAPSGLDPPAWGCDPRLAKPRLGLNSDRRSAADWAFKSNALSPAATVLPLGVS